MSERGGWCLMIEQEDRMRVVVVSNPHLHEAKRLALALTGSGTIVAMDTVSRQGISKLNMDLNEVRESAEIGWGGNA